MLRSGFLLGVGGPAAILTLLVLPSVRASADRLTLPQTSQVEKAAQGVAPLPGTRPVSLQISPVHDRTLHVAGMPRSETRSLPPAPASVGPTAGEKEMPKPRRLTREGCETPLSSLVGPEARRMVPGRCMT